MRCKQELLGKQDVNLQQSHTMINPLLIKNLLEVIRSLPDEDWRWLQEQFGQESAELISQDLADLAQAGQTFEDLAQEPELYSFTDGEPIVAA